MIRFLAIALIAAPAAAAPPAGPGAQVYAEHCARCHGPEGRSDLPGTPDFTRGEGLAASDAALIDTIRNGRGAMPGFYSLIPNEELIDVLFYIRALAR